MAKRSLLVFLIAVCMALSMVAGDLLAVGSGGFENQVLSGKALGMGNAFAGQADDATAVYFNPAGITQLDGVNLSFGLNLVAPVNKFKATAAGDTSQDAKSETFVIPDLYLTMKVQDKLSLGLGIYSNFGLATDWGKTGDLRYIATKSELSILSIAPVAAYKINSKFSAGIGIEYYMLTKLSLKKQLPSITALGVPTGLADGTQELSGDGNGIGATASILYNLAENQKIGVTYRTSAKIDIDGDIKLTGLSGVYQAIYGTNYTAAAESSITLPPRAILGYSWQASEKWLVNVDYEWTGWSTYDEMVVTSAGTKTIEKKNYQDVSSVGLGCEYKLDESWKLRGGWFYFEAPGTQKYFTPSIPDVSKHCITLGCGYTVNSIVIDAGYGYLIGNEREIVNDPANGKYSSTTNLLSLNFGYKF